MFTSPRRIMELALEGDRVKALTETGMPLDRVIPGWAEGIRLMPVGSKYKLWIPGNLGYGEQVPPGAPFPATATLVFEVELLDIVKPPKG